MDRKSFIKSFGALSALSLISMRLRDIENLAQTFARTERTPVLFVGHGNPMNAIEDNVHSRAWKEVAKDLHPQLILCISAHWESRGTYITGDAHPKTIHDFGGFPQALFDANYPAPGSPETATLIQQQIQEPEVHLTDRWGLDHGTWSVLLQMFPSADIPVLQMSMDRTLSPAQMYQLGKQLAFLRSRGVLIMGSGNIVHNLGMVRWGDDPEPYDWAVEFDNKVKELIDRRDHAALIRYRDLGRAAQLSVPTPDHYLPLLYTLGLQEKAEEVYYFNETMAFGSGSMRSFVIT